MNDEQTAHVLDCTPGQYPWDDWKKRALERGLDEDLAIRGREVMREAYQHQWDRILMWLCGWEDEGSAMLELAQAAPKSARLIWRKLLATDGGRGAYEEKTGKWIFWQ
jgi:hypothetical protein